MAQVRYNMIGPVDVPEETNSGLVLLPTNNTLIAMPFKGEKGPRKPEEIPAEFTKSTEEVMEYTQPEVKVKIKTGNPDNAEAAETIRFRGGVEAFSPQSIKKNSTWLRKLEAEFQASESLVDRIDKNAQFRKALDDPKARDAVVAMLSQIIDELTDSLPVVEED
ncbi:MAG: hypothetical protein AAFW73_25210 [Bacteroidota bacterium]